MNRYYESEGSHDPILIEYPKGRYVPVFTKNNDLTTAEFNERPQIAGPVDKAQGWVEKKKEWSSPPILKRIWTLSLAGVLVALIAGSLVLWRLWQRPEVQPKEMCLKPLTSNPWDNPPDSAAISPDGTYLAFCSKGKQFIQIISSKEKRLIPVPESIYPAKVAWFP